MQVTVYGRGSECCTRASPAMLSGSTVTMQYVVCYTDAGTYVTEPSLVPYTSRS